MVVRRGISAHYAFSPFLTLDPPAILRLQTFRRRVTFSMSSGRQRAYLLFESWPTEDADQQDGARKTPNVIMATVNKEATGRAQGDTVAASPNDDAQGRGLSSTPNGMCTLYLDSPCLTPCAISSQGMRVPYDPSWDAFRSVHEC